MGRRLGYAMTVESTHSKVVVQKATRPLNNITNMRKDLQRGFHF